jgi:hypothetical protein
MGEAITGKNKRINFSGELNLYTMEIQSERGKSINQQQGNQMSLTSMK